MRAELDAVDRSFMAAFNRGDAAAAALGAYTRDAQIQPPGAPMVEGRDHIAAFWAGAQQQLGIRSAELVTLRLREAGPYIHQLGAVTLTLAGGEKVEGKYAVLWKQEDGAWKWDVDTWNLNG